MTACILIISALTGQVIDCVAPDQIAQQDQWTRLQRAVEAAKEADERVKAWLEAEPPYDGSLEEIIERIAGLPAAIRDMKEG